MAVIVVAGATDHVQIAPDHPHIRAQVNAFQEAGAKLIRLNPDRAYVEWLFDGEVPDVPDNDAGLRYTPKTVKAALSPVSSRSAIRQPRAKISFRHSGTQTNHRSNDHHPPVLGSDSWPILPPFYALLTWAARK